MAKRTRTPQEKKVLRYEKDRRNSVAESRSIAHRAIAKRKAGANQALRRDVHQTLSAGLRKADSPEEFDAHVPRTGRKSWRKSADQPLADHIQARIDGRPTRGMSSVASESSLLAAAKRNIRKKRGP